jgi:hypothetical protein
MSSDAIVLTATVTPQVAVRRSDPDIRAADYRRAIVSWTRVARRLGMRLVVAENSGYGAARLVSTSSVVPLDIPIPPSAVLERGKGAAEALIVRGALDQLELANGSRVVKATGRLRLSNPRSSLRALPHSAFVRISLDDALGQADTRCFAARLDVITALLDGIEDEIDDDRGVYIEHAAYRRLRHSIDAGEAVFDRFPREPRIRGVSGTSNQRYVAGPDTMRFRLSSAASRVVPAVGPEQRRVRLLTRDQGGWFDDGWASTVVVRRVRRRGSTIMICGRLPSEYEALRGQRLTIRCDGREVLSRDLPIGAFSWNAPMPPGEPDSMVEVEIRAERSFIPSEMGLNDDLRRLAFVLDEVRIGEPEPRT